MKTRAIKPFFHGFAIHIHTLLNSRKILIFILIPTRIIQWMEASLNGHYPGEGSIRGPHPYDRGIEEVWNELRRHLNSK